MSLDDAKKMIEKLKTEKGLMEKVKAADNEGKKKIAKDMGLAFTADEMKEAIKADSKLSDEDLDTVAGGASATWVTVGVTSVGAAATCGW
ncbi:Nif11-like leader peptide family RiPP precursor [Desulforegula conservatrix]|uniref:Nif11-like leader peptide family RiPP precursor n=1 Tax=Desulforegula conservatrix TaxID=153026 RepID=UPI00040FFDA5|nr:Nif11-like leader peptide family RiPP precursor [Desulforegula conservatrix]